MIQVEAKSGRIEEAEADTWIVNLFEDVTSPAGATGAVDRAMDGGIRRAIEAGIVSGRRDAAAVLPTYGKLRAARVVVAGLGPADAFGLPEARRAAAVAARAARRAGGRNLASVVHGGGIGGLAYGPAAQATALGMRSGLWRYDGYRTEAPREAQVERLAIVEADVGRKAELDQALHAANVLADSVGTAREIGVLGANEKYPERVAERARAYAAQHNLDIKVLDETDLAEMGAGAILGVGQGSVHPPRMVVLTLPGRSGGPTLGLVGKGITFDSGGISLKQADGMEDMKYDLCGAAAVLAAMGALARLGSPAPVIGVMCMAENLPSGSAQRPGDVVRTLDGQTIEVVNTDAEGRLVLSDGLALARRLGATHLADAATLTGAVMIALGHAYSGLMASDTGIAQAVERAAAAAAEPVWRLPIDHPQYEEAIRSRVADMKNSGGRAGGAMTAAALLRRFTGGLPWAHLDIAGTAWTTELRPDIEVGPTGTIVETFARLPEALFSA